MHFYVERREDNGYGVDNSKITFSNEVFNVGGGFDWMNQVFRAPFAGTYFFSITGSKEVRTDTERANVAVKLNNKSIGEALSSGGTMFGGFSYQFTLKLVAQDIIELEMLHGQIYLLYFTGSMLDQDLTT